MTNRIGGVMIVAVLALAALGAGLLAPERSTGAAVPVTFTGPSSERDSIVAHEARRAGMDPALAIAVSHVENRGGDSTVVHPRSGAIGLMQIMPFWADSFQVECYGQLPLTVRNRNACIGVQIALRYFNECGNWSCALKWYVGARCVSRDLPSRCQRKTEAGETYVLEVVERFGRRDLSPARDAMAHGGWRTAQASWQTGSHLPSRIPAQGAHSSGEQTRLAAGVASGAPLP